MYLVFQARLEEQHIDEDVFDQSARNKHQNKTLEQVNQFLQMRIQKAKILGL